MSDRESLILLRLALQLGHFFVSVLCVFEKLQLMCDIL